MLFGFERCHRNLFKVQLQSYLMENQFETTPLGIHCVAIHKVAKMYGLPLPSSNVHVYLAGLVERVSSPETQGIFSSYVVGSVDELLNKVTRHKNDPQPNAVPYLISRFSGDFFLDYNALLDAERDVDFPALCYSLAEFYSAKLGRRDERHVFRELAIKPEPHVDLLSKYHRHLRFHPDFELTDEDYLDFRKDFRDAAEHIVKVEIPVRVRKKPSDKLLV
jgi:hypothetical protein